ncbi:dihydrodipicolinate synthase family protein, partial [Ruminococcaceae bacterium OttesenSCG-928-I18]|nr:dihydrodipicolinate synthase family protein [Ruminococcaceae bacterium OttesenSCG-928-I18]
RISVVAGTGCPRAVDTIELCNYAAEVGADAALVITPHYMIMTEDMLYDYYKTVAENSKIGVVIYHYALASGVMLQPEFVKKLSSIDNIVGLKNTEDMDHTAKVIALTADDPDFKIAIGYDSLAVANLATGGDGSMGVVHNVVPKEMEKIYAAMKNNDVKEACKLNARLQELVMLLEAEPYPGPLKVAFDLMGLPGGVPRKPIAPPSDKMRADMKACLTKLGVI